MTARNFKSIRPRRYPQYQQYVSVTCSFCYSIHLAKDINLGSNGPLWAKYIVFGYCICFTRITSIEGAKFCFFSWPLQISWPKEEKIHIRYIRLWLHCLRSSYSTLLGLSKDKSIEIITTQTIYSSWNHYASDICRRLRIEEVYSDLFESGYSSRADFVEKSILWRM